MDDADRVLAAAILEVFRSLTRHGVARGLRGRDDDQALSATDAWLLDHVGRHGSAGVSAIAVWQGVDRSTVSTQLGRLEKRGLIARRADPRDGRAVLVELTDDGRRRSGVQIDDATRFIAQAVESWDSGDRVVLAELLTRLSASLEESSVPSASGSGASGSD